MGWFDDYDRGFRYDRGYRYDRDRRGEEVPLAYGSVGGFNGLGYWHTPYWYGRGPGDARAFGYGRDYRYDRIYRRPPEQSPTYGRRGDREVRRWATRHGYDAGYTIQPHPYGARRESRYDWGYGW